MRTVYDQNGKPRVFKQDVDALHAVQAGMLFEVPPKGSKIASKQKVDKNGMTPQQLVDYAKKEFDVDLDPLMRQDMLMETIDGLEEPKRFLKPATKAKKTLRQRVGGSDKEKVIKRRATK